MPAMTRIVVVAFALLVAFAAPSSAAEQKEFLATSDVKQQKQEQKQEQPAETVVAAGAPIEVVAAKEIELDVSNPYPQTGATAEALALLFMIVACMICYLECCK
eukprot:gb/GFBE01064128.1/.p1 GENE.gb/GFBE01064128.1/~~gb/GFBE01064128.1/.p1  ORF type:complete len:104 (+),score=37.60 gb/GFBE01064128.1/:1-312(+)